MHPMLISLPSKLLNTGFGILVFGSSKENDILLTLRQHAKQKIIKIFPPFTCKNAKKLRFIVQLTTEHAYALVKNPLRLKIMMKRQKRDHPP